MLKIITTLALSLMMIVPTMAQEDLPECATPEFLLEGAISFEPTAYELDRLPVDGLGFVMFVASPNQDTIIALSFGLDGCFIGKHQEITVEEYESGTGKTLPDDATSSTPRT